MKGQVSTGAKCYWIDDEFAATAVKRCMELKPTIEPGRWYAGEELRLSVAFNEVVLESTFPGVGGFSFNLLGSPLGHCYQSHSGSLAWDGVAISENPTPEYRHFQKSGTAHYQYMILSSYRGAGVAGAFLPQINLGFIYCPLKPGELLEPGLVLRRPGVTLEELRSEMNQIAADLISPDGLIF